MRTLRVLSIQPESHQQYNIMFIKRNNIQDASAEPHQNQLFKLQSYRIRLQRPSKQQTLPRIMMMMMMSSFNKENHNALLRSNTDLRKRRGLSHLDIPLRSSKHIGAGKHWKNADFTDKKIKSRSSSNINSCDKIAAKENHYVAPVSNANQGQMQIQLQLPTKSTTPSPISIASASSSETLKWSNTNKAEFHRSRRAATMGIEGRGGKEDTQDTSYFWV